MRTPVTVAVVGLGAWGMSVARLLEELPQAELRHVYDSSPRTELRLRALLGAQLVAGSLDDVLDDETVDAVVVGAPSPTRAELVRAVLSADKHLLLRPPLALSGDDAAELAELASMRRRRLALAYRFSFSPGVRKLRELLEDGHLGELYYVDIDHHDPGTRGSERNVLWGLGHEQMALVSQLLGDEPVEVAARGEAYVEPGIVDVAHVSLRFATGISAQIHLSWLGSGWSYRLTAVGSERTAVIDGVGRERALEVHYSDGGVVAPRLADDEPLRMACTHFLGLVRGRGYEASEAREAARVVGVLDALQSSLDRGGMPERSDTSTEATVFALPSH